MISNFNEIKELFEKINNISKNKIKVYVIGGAVLLEQNLKPATKDIDLIVNTKEEFVNLQKLLQKIGFIGKIPGNGYSHMNLSQIFQKEEFRIDLFEKKVCGKFSISEEIIKRARKIISLSNLEVFFCSNEDIFLFKSMTDRDGDLTDCESLVKAAIDWNVILKELKNQIEKSKQDVWITWVGERFDVLEDRGMIIPIMNELNLLRNKFFKNFE